MAESNLLNQRQSFPALEHQAYFNYGGQGPLSQVAIAAFHQAYHTLQSLGPFSGAAQTWGIKTAHNLRSTIATELGVTPDTIALTENVSVGCNIALWGIDWQAGDHLLISDCEHQGIVAAALALQQRFGITISTFKLLDNSPPTADNPQSDRTQSDRTAIDPISQIRQALQPRTRLVVLSHILWNTGQVLPLKEIMATCHAYPSTKPIRVLVDAAQSVGVLSLNLQDLGVDLYGFTGHKWWCGPEGVGGLYVRRDLLTELHPTFIGWRGITTDSTGSPTGHKPTAQRFEIATSAYPLYAGLTAAIAHHHTWGTPEQRYQRICSLSGHLWQKLQALPGVNCLQNQAPESGLVAFQLDRPTSEPKPEPTPEPTLPDRLVKYLETQQILVRTLANPSCVRACVHYLTLESEVDQLVQAIGQFLAEDHSHDL